MKIFKKFIYPAFSALLGALQYSPFVFAALFSVNGIYSSYQHYQAQVRFIQTRTEAGTEAHTEAGTEAHTEAGTEAHTEAGTESFIFLENNKDSLTEAEVLNICYRVDSLSSHKPDEQMPLKRYFFNLLKETASFLYLDLLCGLVFKQEYTLEIQKEALNFPNSYMGDFPETLTFTSDVNYNYPVEYKGYFYLKHHGEYLFEDSVIRSKKFVSFVKNLENAYSLQDFEKQMKYEERYNPYLELEPYFYEKLFKNVVKKLPVIPQTISVKQMIEEEPFASLEEEEQFTFIYKETSSEDNQSDSTDSQFESDSNNSNAEIQYPQRRGRFHKIFTKGTLVPFVRLGITGGIAYGLGLGMRFMLF